MLVYLLRHGIAEDARLGKTDAERELTAEGRRKLRETLRAAAQAQAKPSLMLTSPLVRALQTAEIAREVLRYRGDVLRTKSLLPNARPEQVWDEIRVHQDQAELMLVGHEPLFSQLAAYLLGSTEIRIDFKKGAILRVDFDTVGLKPNGVLRWFMTAKLANRNTVSVLKKRAH
ncbi:MAG: histidine phosphatase family protein [Bryobacteraceae bacterium]